MEQAVDPSRIQGEQQLVVDLLVRETVGEPFLVELHEEADVLDLVLVEGEVALHLVLSLLLLLLVSFFLSLFFNI